MYTAVLFVFCAVQLALAAKHCPPNLGIDCVCESYGAGGDEDVGDVILSCVRLDQEAFKNLTSKLHGYRFTELNFRHSTFTKLHAFAFENVTINGLNIENVTISEVDVDAFSKVPHLETVDIRRTYMRHVPIFRDISHSLIEMSITDNNIEDINKNEFVDLVNLEEIDLNLNNITDVEDEAFHSLKHLKDLYLDHNAISSIGNWFKMNKALRVLSLEHNKIKKFPEDLFTMLPGLEELDIDNNDLVDIPEKLFRPFLEKPYSELSIDGNNITCDTSLCWVFKYFEKHTPSNLYGKCLGPHNLAGRQISDVDDEKDVKCRKQQN